MADSLDSMDADLPECLRARSLRIPHPRVVAPPGPVPEFNNPAGAPGDDVVIHEFRIFAQYQILSLWCWNAVGAAITQFHLRGESAGYHLQCMNAQRLQLAQNCCGIKLDGVTPLDQVDAYMDHTGVKPMNYALGESLGNKRGLPQDVTNMTHRFLAADQNAHAAGPGNPMLLRVIASIHAGCPVVMHLTYPGGGGSHLQTIYGTRVHAGVRYFDVADPITGFEVIERPQRDALWSGTIFLVPAGGNLG